jgi:hypothetical protein
MAQDKETLALVEGAVHDILRPLGFKKQKTSWRRDLPEVLQQFSLAKKPVGPSWYGPEWGLNLFAFSENPRPLPHQLHVSWLFEHFVRPRKKMLAIAGALKLWTEVAEARRVQFVSDLLNNHVLPCFELYQTREAVRRMMGEYAAPLRAQGFGGCPPEWWPHDE